jgi:hypothetical protein
MITDYDTALLLQKQYDGAQGSFAQTYTIEGDVLSIDETDDYIGFNFEGSHDFLNWWNNFQAIMIYPHELNGAGVEQGFWKNIKALAHAANFWISKAINTGKKALVKGHSRGAGMADQFGALLACQGCKALELVTFGRPNPGDEKLAKLLAPFPNRSYWNYRDWFHHDPVGDAPPHLLFSFTQTSKRIPIDIPPAPNDSWGDALGWHHLSPNYASGTEQYVKGISNGKTVSQP